MLSVRTVETHLYRAMRKLGVSDRHDLRVRSGRAKCSTAVRPRVRAARRMLPAMRTLKRLLPLALVVAAALAIAPAAASAAVPQACPAGFTVLHDDSIGVLPIPAGTYQLAVADPSLLTCDEASDRFQLFLQDFDGRLPQPWTVDPATATFSAGNGIAFQIARLIGPGPVHPAGRVCPRHLPRAARRPDRRAAAPGRALPDRPRGIPPAELRRGLAATGRVPAAPEREAARPVAPERRDGDLLAAGRHRV